MEPCAVLNVAPSTLEPPQRPPAQSAPEAQVQPSSLHAASDTASLASATSATAASAPSAPASAPPSPGASGAGSASRGEGTSATKVSVLVVSPMAESTDASLRTVPRPP